MTKHVKEILELTDRHYGTDIHCFLHYGKPYELLFSTIMSAQCTDARVNEVTKELFVKYPSLENFANADLKELENDIHSVGFFHMKAVHIIECAKALIDRFGGEVPRDIDDLTSLPGVGRKTANVVRTHVFEEPSVVVDTHVKRVSGKLGLTRETDPVKIEFDLMKKIPKDHWSLINLHFITLGRELCIARRPKCDVCFLKDVCPSAGKK